MSTQRCRIIASHPLGILQFFPKLEIFPSKDTLIPRRQGFNLFFIILQLILQPLVGISGCSQLLVQLVVMNLVLYHLLQQLFVLTVFGYLLRWNRFSSPFRGRSQRSYSFLSFPSHLLLYLSLLLLLQLLLWHLRSLLLKLPEQFLLNPLVGLPQKLILFLQQLNPSSQSIRLIL